MDGLKSVLGWRLYVSYETTADGRRRVGCNRKYVFCSRPNAYHRYPSRWKRPSTPLSGNELYANYTLTRNPERNGSMIFFVRKGQTLICSVEKKNSGFVECPEPDDISYTISSILRRPHIAYVGRVRSFFI